MKALAASIDVIPASLSSFTSRSCKVWKARSERPRKPDGCDVDDLDVGDVIAQRVFVLLKPGDILLALQDETHASVEIAEGRNQRSHPERAADGNCPPLGRQGNRLKLRVTSGRKAESVAIL